MCFPLRVGQHRRLRKGRCFEMSAAEYVLRLLPSIVTAVAAVEKVAELKRQGARKKAVVMAVLAGSAAAGELVPDAHVQAYSATVDAVAAALFPKVQAVTEMAPSSRSGFGSEGTVRQ